MDEAELCFVILQRFSGPSHHVMNGLATGVVCLGNFCQRQVIKDHLFKYILLMLCKKFPVKVIKHGTLINLFHAD